MPRRIVGELHGNASDVQRDIREAEDAVESARQVQGLGLEQMRHGSKGRREGVSFDLSHGSPHIARVANLIVGMLR
jgi:hypothetical protein